MSDSQLVQRAPGTSACCDPAGRICGLAHRAVRVDLLVAIAVQRGEGTEAQVRARIADMLAGGMLIELEG